MEYYYGFLIVFIAIFALNFLKETQPVNLEPLKTLRELACNSVLVHQLTEECLMQRNHPDYIYAVGFASLVDLRVRGKDFLQLLEAPDQMNYHYNIETRDQLSQTIAYYFSKGASMEIRIAKDLFNSLVEEVLKMKNKKVQGGGNGLIIASRLAWEGRKVQHISAITQQQGKKFQGLVQEMNPPSLINDYHLIIEYSQGEKWGKFQASRSNRIYFNHDQVNINPEILKGYDYISPEVKVIVVGGLQLIQGVPQSKIFLQKLDTILEKNKGKKIHFQLGDLYDNEYYDSLLKILKKVDSIGLNQQELGKLVKMLEKQPFQGYDSKADLNTTINDMAKLIQYHKKQNYKFNRIHLHSLSSQAICSTEQ